MIFPIVYMSENTEAIICFILFSHIFSDRSYGSYMIQSSAFDKIKFEIKNYLKMLAMEGDFR